jgi:hypothetical protein
MAEIPLPLSDFAARLLWHQAGTARNPEELVDALDRACLALHERFAPLISSAGFHALLNRAARLAARDFPFLTAVSVATTATTSLGSLRRSVEGREPGEVAEGLILFLANFLWLLVIFIGENLGLGKVREVWPEVPLGEVGPSSEKAKR